MLINNATYQRETLSERPIRQPLTFLIDHKVSHLQGILKVNQVSFWPLYERYRVVAILTVTHGGELLYLRIWCDHLARSAQIIVAACFTARYPI